MKNKLSINYLLLIFAPLVFACAGPATEENKSPAMANPVSAGEKYSIDPKETVITWSGSMLLSPDEEHVGYVYPSKGELMIEKDQLVGGTVEIDMNSIEYKDKKNKNTPVMHLMSPDYFDVKKYPVSTIAITRVTSAGDSTINVTGNLTIKGVTNPVTFPAKIEVKDGIVKGEGKLIIDRTEWGIRYNSGKFYDIVADEIVSDDIKFIIKIAAKK